MGIVLNMDRCLKRVDTIVMAMIFVLVLTLHQALAFSPASAVSASESGLCARSDPSMDPVHEIRYGVDVVWQIPTDPKALLFIAHGMFKEPLSFFDPGPHCEQCYGLPEDRGAVLEALQRQYAVIMVKSVDTYWLPWNVETWPVPISEDRMNVPRIIREWTDEHGLDHLPLTAWGHSSGGNFSTLLTLDLDIKSLILMCTPGEFAVLERADKASFPPTLYVSMPADNDRLGFYPLILNSMEVLNARGVLLAEVPVLPKPVTPHLFSDEILCLDPRTSENIHAAYKTEGWLNETDFLVVNPRIGDWEGVLSKWDVLPYCSVTNDLCYAQHVDQELMVSYAEHSFTKSANEAIFNWLDSTAFFDSTPFSSSDSNAIVGVASS